MYRVTIGRDSERGETFINTCYATTEQDARRVVRLARMSEFDAKIEIISVEEIRADLYKQILAAIDADDLDTAKDLNSELKNWG